MSQAANNNGRPGKSNNMREDEHRPLQLMRIKKGDNAATAEAQEVEVIMENLNKLDKILADCGAATVSIVAVMGMFRTGKSFILDLIIRYFKKRLMLEGRNNGESQETDMDAEDFSIIDHITQANAPDPQDHHKAPVRIPEGALHLDTSQWRYQEKDREKNQKLPPWVLERNSQHIREGNHSEAHHEGFKWMGGAKRCTEGIWVWSEPFCFYDQDGTKVAVMLMDTQGCWDNQTQKSVSATLFGMTALLSSKLVVNIRSNISENEIGFLDYITTFTQTVLKTDAANSQTPFGALEMLVRDYSNFEDGWTMEQCKAEIQQHLHDHVSSHENDSDKKTLETRLNSTFNRINCHALCHPGIAVTKPSYDGEIAVIDRDFFVLLDNLTKTLFGADDFPVPSAPLGMTLSADGFAKTVINFAKAFGENAVTMAVDLRKAFVEIEIGNARSALIKKCREELHKIAPETTVVDPGMLREKSEKLETNLKEQFARRLQPLRIEESKLVEFQQEFAEDIQRVILVRESANSAQVDGATLKIVASPVVGCGVWFFSSHVVITTICAAGGMFVWAKKWSDHDKVDICHWKVANGIANDAAEFSKQRYRDSQAMWIAAKRINFDDVIRKLIPMTNMAANLTNAGNSQHSQAHSGTSSRPS
eukprot:CAMPEP_0170603362 /NCGR_PEP_ID=MMETSP0224-20130122/18873_1 /TAXON_ID=285029 /ORGANISM="Togula jolla, Strain CCCM 725" /LENGTH=647 /DNA_ID=CAMNT_0010928241 /DNA_START=50 /DNA_END=1993 /DNA_ORIENTATION=-